MQSSVPTMDDREMVELARSDVAFFGEIVVRYQDKLDRYIARLGVKNSADREDVLQEIFLKVYKNLNDFDPTLSFSAWIYRIAHNEAITWYRKLKVRPEGYLVADSETILEMWDDKEESAAARFDRNVDALRLGRSLEKLDDKYRDVLVLRYFEHLEYEEISDVLKIPVGTVGTLVHRAKKKLRELLENYE